jgi:hypothetical protein
MSVNNTTKRRRTWGSTYGGLSMNVSLRISIAKKRFIKLSFLNTRFITPCITYVLLADYQLGIFSSLEGIEISNIQQRTFRPLVNLSHM